MAYGPTYVVRFRRRREGRTDFRHRLRQVISDKPRIITKLTNRYIWASLSFYKEGGDEIKTTLCSKVLGERGFSGSLKNTPSAYAFGLLCAKEFLRYTKEAIIDLGRRPFHKGGRISAFVKGLIEGGLAVPYGEEAAPAKERLEGKHLKSKLDFAKLTAAMKAGGK